MDNGLAAELVVAGKAVEIRAKPSAEIVIEQRDPIVEDRDPKSMAPTGKKTTAKPAAKE